MNENIFCVVFIPIYPRNRLFAAKCFVNFRTFDDFHSLQHQIDNVDEKTIQTVETGSCILY